MPRAAVPVVCGSLQCCTARHGTGQPAPQTGLALCMDTWHRLPRGQLERGRRATRAARATRTARAARAARASE